MYAELSYLSSAASRRVSSRWAVDAEEVAGVEIVLLWAVPNVSAELASWALRSRGIAWSNSVKKRQAVAGSGWMACFLCFPLLCTETGTNSAFLLAGFGVLQYIDKVVDVLGTRLLYGGLWKNFTCFLRAHAVCLESGLYFLEPFVLAATCPVRCDSPRKLLDEFRLFST